MHKSRCYSIRSERWAGQAQAISTGQAIFTGIRIVLLISAFKGTNRLHWLHQLKAEESLCTEENNSEHPSVCLLVHLDSRESDFAQNDTMDGMVEQMRCEFLDSSNKSSCPEWLGSLFGQDCHKFTSLHSRVPHPGSDIIDACLLTSWY